MAVMTFDPEFPAPYMAPQNYDNPPPAPPAAAKPTTMATVVKSTANTTTPAVVETVTPDPTPRVDPTTLPKVGGIDIVAFVLIICGGAFVLCVSGMGIWYLHNHLRDRRRRMGFKDGKLPKDHGKTPDYSEMEETTNATLVAETVTVPELAMVREDDVADVVNKLQ